MSAEAPRAREPRLTVAGRMQLAVEIVRAYAEVRRTTRAHRLVAAVELLRDGSGRSPAPRLRDPDLEGVRLGRAVVRTLWPLPRGTKCLMRSQVLLVLLARRGAKGTLVIAVHPGEQMLDAHAWVELDDRPLLAPGTRHERLLVL